MNEAWADIYDFPGYTVSNHGRVRNEKRGRLVQPSYNSRGSLKVGLVIGGKQYTRSLKVLVGEAFCGGGTDKFNTPILLDGNQENVRADNLQYRPLWFAWKYVQQFEYIHEYIDRGPIQEIKSGDIYSSIADASVINGLLCREVHVCIAKHTNVFPTWQIFEWVRD